MVEGRDSGGGGSVGGDEARGILDALLAELPGVVYRCRNDRDWTMLGLTANVEELTGYTPADLVDSARLPFVELIHPDDRERVRSQVEAAVAEGAAFRVAYRIVTRYGEERWVLEQGRAARVQGDTVLAGYIQDLTAPIGRQLAEREADLDRTRRQGRYLEMLQSVTAIANEEQSFHGALRAAIPVICRAIGFAVGHAFVPAGEGIEGLRSSDIWHLEGEDDEEIGAFVDATEATDWSREDGLPGRVMRTGHAEWVEDVSGDAEARRVEEDRPCPVESGLAVPVMSGSRVLAVLELYTVQRMEPDAPLQRLLEQIGVQLGRVWERERAGRARRTSELRFRQLAENLEAVLGLTNLAGEILYLSPGFQRLTGREGIEDWSQLLELVHRGDRARLSDLFSDPQRAPYELEYRIVRPDGETRWIRQSGFPIRDEAGEVYRIGTLAEDITEERRARERLEETTRLLEQTIASIEEAVVVVDSSDDGRGILEVNEAAERMFGYTRDEMVGGTTEKLHVDRESFERFGAESQPVLQREGVFRASYPLRRKDGTRFEAEQTVTLLNPEEGLEGGVVSVVRDVSEREALEAQLRGAQRMEAVGRLAGGIAHDFNNLLTVIRGQCDLLFLDLAPSSPLREELETIRSAADRAAQLTSQLLAFGREQVLRPQVVDLNEIVADMGQLLVRVLGEDIEIETELAEDLPPVEVDPGQLEQVLMNLAVNARDAMPVGGTLSLSTRLDDLDAEQVASIPGLRPGTHVCLVVADTGAGMDADTRARIFEPFFTTKRESGGTGLGLAMSYGIVKQSGGTIHVDSRPGRGSTFLVRFPPADGTPRAGPVSAAGEVDPADVSGTVLVVEDDRSVRELTRRVLDRAGFRVRVAEDAEAGMEILETEGPPDLVLTDLVLPGMSGRSFVDRARERFSDLPVIVMSGYAEGSAGNRDDLPADIAFIPKPFSPDGLLQTVREQLGKR